MTFDGLPARGQGLQGGVGRDRARDPDAVGVARRDPRARPSARRDPACLTWPRRADEVEIAGTVAIVGFPNVGKSTLINRLTATRAAVVHETPGVTRDRKELHLPTGPARRFRLIDTGGVDRADTGPFGPQIAAQARQAIAEADLVLFVVDATGGVTPGDEELAEILRVVAASGARAREQARRPAPRPRGARVPPPRPRRPDSDLGAPRPRHGRPPRRDRRAACPAEASARSERRRSGSRSSGARTSASRRS